MFVRNSSCGICSMYNGERSPDSSVTVPAGDVQSGLSACGYEGGMTMLPKVTAVDQSYTQGFCPDSALCRGTLFPELASEY